MWNTIQLIYKSPMSIIGLFLIAIASGCSHQTGNEAELLVKSSIEAHGGQKLYNELTALSFKKTTRLFLEDGTLESEVIQDQSFQLKPDYRVLIEWTVKGAKHVIFYDGKNAVKTISSEVINDSTEILKAKNAAKAAAYVFFQPFELINENTMLTMEANTQLNDSSMARTVSVKYQGDDADSDKWRYYFNDDDLLIANSVVLMDHSSLIENLEFQNVAGLIFNKYRKSYRVDSSLNKKYLRAEYFYDAVSISK